MSISLLDNRLNTMFGSFLLVLVFFQVQGTCWVRRFKQGLYFIIIVIIEIIIIIIIVIIIFNVIIVIIGDVVRF